MAPHQLEGLEYYSTALWHTKSEVELSFLAQQVVKQDKLSPQVPPTQCLAPLIPIPAGSPPSLRKQTWIVVGNCFSLQKEHEAALKFFGRVRCPGASL